MGCNCDCYCGCATRSNRVKYLASGVLFCVWCLLQFYTFEQVQACQDNYPPGATVDTLVASAIYCSVCSTLIQGLQGMRAECAVHDVRLDRGHLGTAPGLWNGTGGRGDPSIPVMCEEAYGKRMKCLLDKAYAPLNVFLNLLKLFALVGFIVPLGMMCCCTKSPHKVCFLVCLVPLSHWNSSQYMEFSLQVETRSHCLVPVSYDKTNRTLLLGVQQTFSRYNMVWYLQDIHLALCLDISSKKRCRRLPLLLCFRSR